MAVWLDAWHDPVASIHTVSSCIRLVDVTGDGDPKLLVADQNRKLRLYKGKLTKPSEHLAAEFSPARDLKTSSSNLRALPGIFLAGSSLL